MTDTDPLSRTGLIVGMVLALFLGGVRETYDTYTNGQGMDTIRQKFQLEGRVWTAETAKRFYIRPERIEIGKINRWVCFYGSGFCNTEFADRIVWWAYRYDVSPYLITAIGLWESGYRFNVSGYCTFGYDSCRTRFTTIDDEVSTVVRTFSGYGSDEIQSLSIWHTGAKMDSTGYPQRVMETARKIGGL